MARKNNIVTFEEARRASKRRRRPAISGTTPSKSLTVALDASASEKPAKKPADTKKPAAFQRKRNAVGSAQDAKKPVIAFPRKQRRSAKISEETPPSGALRRESRSSSVEKGSRTSRDVQAATTRKQAREASKRRRTKERAGKKFTRMYGDGSPTRASNGAGQDAGPRAAVYQAKMGGKHRKAARALQQRAADGLSSAAGFVGGINMPRWNALPKAATRALTTVFCVVFLAFMLYAPAQQCYQQMRDRDRAAAEYAAVLDRNQALVDSVDTLQSEEGIEDKAHAEYGMVKEDEQAGSVAGINVQSSTDFVANVVPGGVPAPDTWYSGFLDFLFGYSNPEG